MSTASLTRSDDIADALRAEVLSDAPALKLAVDAYGREVRAVHDAGDVVAQMRAAAGLILAAEGVEAAAGAVAQQARAALAAAMLDTGAPTLAVGTQRVAAHEGKRTVVVTDPAAIPPDLMTCPEPRPDKAAILKRLMVGEAIPGCALSNGGTPFLSFHVRKG